LGKVIGKKGATDDEMRIILHAASAKQKNGALWKSSSAVQAVKGFCPLITGCLSDQRAIGSCELGISEAGRTSWRGEINMDNGLMPAQTQETRL
jgi:hypothetical protein